MKVKLVMISIILLLVMVFASGCIPIMEKLGLVSPTDEEQLTPQKASSDGLVKVLIGFKEKPGAAQQVMVQGVGGKIKYTYHIVDAIAASIPEKAIVALQNNPNVTHVEYDIKVYALDTELNDSWGVERIGAGIVHDDGNKGAGIKIAIIDSGIDYTHSDLDANYVSGYDFVNSDTEPMDDDGHGTHVAGIVAAEDDGFGVVGVAPEAKLYALKVLEGGSGNYSDVMAALQWCVDNNIQVTNNSYGSSGDPGELVKKAFDDSATAGVLHVAAAGNSGNPPGRGDNIIYPARYESVIAVAATDQNDKRARWSSTGPDLDLSAPGVAINSTLLGGGYGEKSGTSMASPHVAGTAALVIAAEISDVRSQLQNTADDLGDSWLYGCGLVDADEAAGVDTPLPGAIAGKVTDTDSTAIKGATVAVEGTTLSATTSDSGGDYTINNVPVGDYTVTASADGYEKASQEVTVEADTTSTANFALNPLSATGTMYVESITFSYKVAGPNKFLYATVKVVDGDGIALEGVRVEMTLDWDKEGDGTIDDSWNFAGDTGTDGTVKFTLNKAPDGSYTATVNSLTLTGYEWDKDSEKGVISADYTL